MTERDELEQMQQEATEKFGFHTAQANLHHEEAVRWQGKALAYGELLAKKAPPTQQEEPSGKPDKPSKNRKA